MLAKPKAERISPDGVAENNTRRRFSLKNEVKRKSIHLAGLSVPAAILFLGREVTIVLVGLVLLIALFLERERLHGKISMPSVREHERYRVAGYIYYIFGAFLTVLLFQPMIAVTAMLMLSIGDAASGLIGSVVRGSKVRADLMGGRGWSTKPPLVMAGTFLVCILVGYLASIVTGLAVPVYLAGALGATLADAIPISFRRRVVDDNFSIPLLSGSVMALASMA